MRESPSKDPPFRKAPVHLWIVGVLSLLWNVWGAYIALSAQSGTLPALRAEDQAFFDAQPLWLVLVADTALLAGIGGALALLLQHRSAVWLYAADFVILFLANVYEIGAGTSPLLRAPGAGIGAAWLGAIIVGEVIYARAMLKRGVLE